MIYQNEAEKENIYKKKSCHKETNQKRLSVVIHLIQDSTCMNHLYNLIHLLQFGGHQDTEQFNNAQETKLWNQSNKKSTETGKKTVPAAPINMSNMIQAQVMKNLNHKSSQEHNFLRQVQDAQFLLYKVKHLGFIINVQC